MRCSSWTPSWAAASSAPCGAVAVLTWRLHPQEASAAASLNCLESVWHASPAPAPSVGLCACVMCRKEEAAALGLKAAVPGEAAEDGLAVTAPLAISCWCAPAVCACVLQQGVGL